MLMTNPLLADLWGKSRAALSAQLVHRPADAVFLEGSIAEGFGNGRSDVDFVAVFESGLEPPTMPYILFIDGSRIEVRLFTSAGCDGSCAGPKHRGIRSRAVARLPWNLLRALSALHGSLANRGPRSTRELQAELGEEALGAGRRTVVRGFRVPGGTLRRRHAGVGEGDYARAWIRTAAFTPRRAMSRVSANAT